MAVRRFTPRDLIGLRHRLNLTTERMAELIGTSHQNYRRWEGQPPHTDIRQMNVYRRRIAKLENGVEKPMIELTAEEAESIYDYWCKTPTPTGMSIGQQFAELINKAIRAKLDDRSLAPEPDDSPRIATVTDLGNDTYQLVIQNGNSIASATMTTPQMIAWEFKEAHR